MRDSEVTHREGQRMPGWARAILWGSVVVFAWVLWRSAEEGEVGRLVALLGGLGVLAVPFLVEALVGTLDVRVGRGGIEARMGRAGLLRKRFAWSEVEAAEAVRYSPIREFGGWGIRWSWRDWKKRAWTQRGNGAVVLHLRDGVRFYLGSDHPERLLERIRAAGYSGP